MADRKARQRAIDRAGEQVAADPTGFLSHASPPSQFVGEDGLGPEDWEKRIEQEQAERLVELVLDEVRCALLTIADEAETDGSWGRYEMVFYRHDYYMPALARAARNVAENLASPHPAEEKLEELAKWCEEQAARFDATAQLGNGGDLEDNSAQAAFRSVARHIRGELG